MRVKYFKDTDTAFLEFSDREVVRSCYVGVDLRIDLDAEDRLVRLTIDHAAEHASLPDVLVMQFDHGSGRHRPAKKAGPVL